MELGFLRGKRTVILGIGNRLKGDDGVGSIIAEELARKVNQPGVLTLDCGLAPENFLGKVTQHKPDCVVLIDTAELGKEPGSVAVIKMDKTSELAPSTTHKMPLGLLANMMHSEFESEIFLVGVQPKVVEFIEVLSSEVEEAKDKIVKNLENLFNK